MVDDWVFAVFWAVVGLVACTIAICVTVYELDRNKKFVEGGYSEQIVGSRTIWVKP